MKNINPLTVLWITDLPEEDRSTVEHLTRIGFAGDLRITGDLPAAFAYMEAGTIDVVLFDLSLLYLEGPYSFRNIVAQAGFAPVILLAKEEASNLAGELVRLGAQDCLIKKQFDADTLLRSVRFSLQRKEKEKERVAVNEKLQNILQVSNDVIWEWDLEQNTLIRDEQQLQELFGIEPSPALSNLSEWFRRIHPEDRERVRDIIQEMGSNPQREEYEVEYRLNRGDGQYIYIYDRCRVVRNSEGEVVKIVGAGQNITGKKKEEEKFALLFNKSPLPTWVYEAGTLRFLEVNEAAVNTYGYSREEFLKLTGKDIRAAKYRQQLVEDIEAILRNGSEHRRKTVHRKKNGESMMVHVTAYPIDFFGQSSILVQAQDITEEERLRSLLEKGDRQKKQEIMEAVLKAEEKERTTIGEELHDNINQVLASAKLYIETALRETEDKDEYLRQGIHIIDMAIQEIRQLSKDLVATGFRHNGLVAAIKDIADIIQTARGIHFNITVEDFEESRLSEGHKLALYRMVQEQLNNIVKHADATEVSIRLQLYADKASLVISDNGKGFNTAAKPKGIGLSNIASRASFYEGTMDIRSAPGAGCTLSVTLSLEK